MTTMAGRDLGMRVGGMLPEGWGDAACPPLSSFLSFGNIFGLDSPFLNFFNFILLPRLITTPYVHMTYVYSFSYVLCFPFT